MVALVAAAATVGTPRACFAAEINKVVASVDGDPITLHDVDEFALKATGTGLPSSDPTSSATFKEALKGLIAQKLLEQEVRKYDDKVDDSQIDRYIAEVEQDRNITDQQLRQSLIQGGLTYDDFRKQARLELEKAMMLNDELRQKVVISPADIQDYYDSHHDQFMVKQERFKLAQILIAVPADAPPDAVAAAQAKALQAHKKALAGQNFGDLAKQYSDDASKEQGGELGVFTPDDITDEILAAIKNLKPGEISEVVRSKHGFHIVKVEQHEVAGLRPLPTVKEDIRNHLIDDQTKGRLQQWVETELVKQHEVETMY